MSGDVIIFGAGGHGRVCAEVAEAARFRVAGFVDASKTEGDVINGIPVVGSELRDLLGQFPPGDTGVFVALGDNDRRAGLVREAETLGFGLPALIDPTAVVSKSAEIGDASVIIATAVVNANSRIGRGCIINTGASVDHDNVLADFVQISPGVRSAGGVSFGERAFVGTGAIIIPGVKIGRGAIVAAGATVIRDVEDGARVVGSPARPMS